jgi:hypothetical protein
MFPGRDKDFAALNVGDGTFLPFANVRAMAVIEGRREVKYSWRVFRLLTHLRHRRAICCEANVYAYVRAPSDMAVAMRGVTISVASNTIR